MSRKKKVLEEVARQRRRRGIISIAIVAVLIIVIVVGIYVFALNQPKNVVSLPPYLDKCVVSELPGYHSHPNLTIIVNGVIHPLTPNIGIAGSCLKPLHTHDSTGVIHIEPDENRTFTLGDFFLVWGNWANDASIAAFNSTQILGYKAGPGTNHHLTMTVNNKTDTSFQNHQFPFHAAPNNSECVYPPCVPDDIVLTYS